MSPTLGEVFDIQPVVAAADFVLELHRGVEQAAQTVNDYVVTESLATAFDDALALIGSGLMSRRDRGVFLHGDFGSGKSHFMAVLDLLLRGDPNARAIAGLQQAVADHEQVLASRVLTVEYHLIGAPSLEQAIFAGYRARVTRLHPEATPPMLHKSDALFVDAAARRVDNEEAFFRTLNGGAADSGWGDFEQAWTPASYDAAVAAPNESPQRQRLAGDLVATMFSGYVSAGEWLDISDGLAAMSEHARGLGYEGLVLFLDELVLWLAGRLSDPEFVADEAAKVAKLVETGMGERAIPIVSFVARQRELREFYAEQAGAAVSGAQRAIVGDAFRYWSGRFDTIELKASNLPDIAHRRLLTPKDDAAAQAVTVALSSLKAHRQAWNALLLDEEGSDEAAFAKVYPFSPALVNALIHLSGLLQRERTALRVMAQLLSQHRDNRTIDQIIPVAELFDALVLKEQPLTQAVRQQFDVARRLYLEKFRPMLLADHNVRDADTEALPVAHPFAVDDRLAKTLLVSALVNVPALQDLSASKLAALNHGSIAAFVPGAEAAAVLTKIRPWAEQIGELEVGGGADPVIRLVLTDVDYESVLNLVQSEDTAGARRNLLRRMVFSQFGIRDDVNLFQVIEHDMTWRGTKRRVDLLFGNIRDESAMPASTIRAQGDRWRVVIDYPFDDEGYRPADDLARFEELRVDGVECRTIGWVPRFLSATRKDDLGRLVLLEFLLGRAGDQFDANAQHLPADQRPNAKSRLESIRRALRDRLDEAVKQAYGVAAAQPADIDTSVGDFQMWPTLDPELTVQPPVGATLEAALQHLADQALSSQYPKHPRFDAEVRPADLNVVLDYVTRAMGDPSGRVDPVESARRAALRRVANPLECGQCYEAHYVFSSETFPWRNEFVRVASDRNSVPVTELRALLDFRGLTRPMQNLLIAAWALLDDKQFLRHGAPVRVTALAEVTDDLELADPELPSPQDWDRARACAAALFGVSVPALRSAANLAQLSQRVRELAHRHDSGCRDLEAQLTTNAAALGVTTDSSRVRTAQTAAQFVPSLAAAQDDLVLCGLLAGFDLPAQPQALAKSISSAAAVAQELRNATWTVLDNVAALAEAGDTEAVAAMDVLRRAAPNEELHAPLAVPLGSATARAASVLTSRRQAPPPPPSPPVPVPPPAPVHVNDITLDGLDGADGEQQLGQRLDQLRDEIGSALRRDPAKQVRIRWWLE